MNPNFPISLIYSRKNKTTEYYQEGHNAFTYIFIYWTTFTYSYECVICVIEEFKMVTPSNNRHLEL